MSLVKSIFVVTSILLCAATAAAHEARLELGTFKTVSNRFNIPNPSGSRFSVESDSLKFYGRGQFLLQLSERGYLRLMVAPLSTDYEYQSVGVTVFNGVTFPASSNLRVSYRFNSYRLGYIHRFKLGESFSAQVGGVGKIRDAKITVASAGLSSSYDNVGFVPLLNVGLLWRAHEDWQLRFDLDGAAASQGRAFDGMLEVFRALDEKGSGISGGIRVLEGGADNEKVNTFALIHYAFLAFTKGF